MFMVSMVSVKYHEIKENIKDVCLFLKDVADLHYDVGDVFDDELIDIKKRLKITELAKYGHNTNWFVNLTEEQKKERLEYTVYATEMIDYYGIDSSDNTLFDYERMNIIFDTAIQGIDILHYVQPDVSVERIKLLHELHTRLATHDNMYQLESVVVNPAFNVSQIRGLAYIVEKNMHISLIPFINSSLNEETIRQLFELVQNNVIALSEVSDIAKLPPRKRGKVIKEKIAEKNRWNEKLASLNSETREYVWWWIKHGIVPDMYGSARSVQSVKYNMHNYIKSELRKVIKNIDELQFTDEKLIELYKGYREGVDISKYAKSYIDDEFMAVAREGLKQNTDITSLIDNFCYWYHEVINVYEDGYEYGLMETEKGFRAMLYLEQLFPGTAKKTCSYFNPLFEQYFNIPDEQESNIKIHFMVHRMRETATFLKELHERTGNMKLVTSFYKLTIEQNRWFFKEQLTQLYHDIVQGIDVTVYANPDYSPGLLHTIRKGLKQGIDITPYIPQIKKCVAKNVRNNEHRATMLYDIIGTLVLKEIQNGRNPKLFLKILKSVESISQIWRALKKVNIDSEYSLSFPHSTL